eukprot:9674836-Ditylum_brightwellii.AAC.1
MEDEFKKNMGHFLNGIKCTVAKAKAQTRESLDKGKKYMIFEVHLKFCKILAKGGGDDYIFAHTFLTLVWNLLACPDNCFA